MAERRMQDDVLVKVSLRNQFYKDGHRKTVIAFLLSMVVNVIMGSLLTYIITHPPAPRYFATSIDGRITPLYPLDKPNMTDAQVLQWAAEAAVAVFSYNFVNYNSELQASSGYFTGYGWRQFQLVLQRSRLVEIVTSKKLILSAEPTGAPEKVRPPQLLSNGRWAWEVRVPLKVYMTTSQSAYTTQNFNVTMVVMRVSTLNAPSGIGIQQILVESNASGVTPNA